MDAGSNYAIEVAADPLPRVIPLFSEGTVFDEGSNVRKTQTQGAALKLQPCSEKQFPEAPSIS